MSSLTNKLFWQLYSVLLVGISCARMLERILTESGGFSSRYLPVIFAVIIAVGIFGSLRETAIYKRWFWRVLSITVSFVTLLAFIFSTYLFIFVDHNMLSASGLILLLAALLIPATIKLTLYSSKSAPYWNVKYNQ